VPSPHASTKPLHPAVAYLSRLRSKEPEGAGAGPAPFSAQRKTLHFMTGGLLGGIAEKHRRSEVTTPHTVLSI